MQIAPEGNVGGSPMLLAEGGGEKRLLHVGGACWSGLGHKMCCLLRSSTVVDLSCCLVRGQQVAFREGSCGEMRRRTNADGMLMRWSLLTTTVFLLTRHSTTWRSCAVARRPRKFLVLLPPSCPSPNAAAAYRQFKAHRHTKLSLFSSLKDTKPPPFNFVAKMFALTARRVVAK